MFCAKKITNIALVTAATCGVIGSISGPVFTANAAESTNLTTKTSAKAAPGKKDEVAKAPEVELTNVVAVTPEDLVAKPHEYLGKNVKFTARFFAFSNLALDYKPAYKASKTHLSLLVLKSGSHIPLSELKLAMAIPHEKDPETALLAQLKDGDTIEVVGKEFSNALDDPWVEIFKLKKIGGSKEADKTKAEASDKKTDEKSSDEGKSK